MIELIERYVNPIQIEEKSQEVELLEVGLKKILMNNTTIPREI